ncbi:hypothetical protein CO174_03880 [Candidatus Uhrbacteria bacterium CG_4_9_14_3_um_filter_50_9]|uniref:Glycosyltransferase n=1 Tax=Candidatus Uhrbacteria bacterium CG_4_9_14_3_um_filter_50_9 TaxID=1975035 RepID=A0A2M7XBP3_9BACT|nr:MAG: hypothetical protein CO174_03880 [Candidatus Uhrbacteria bacterium CG_4_9_14_3_um_filter_50_9]
MTRILFVTTSPQLAGAEKQLLALASGLDREQYEVMVVTLKGEREGRLLEVLRRENIKTESLNIQHKWELWKLIRLFKILKTFQPDILQSFLFFDNVVARLFGYLNQVPVVISGQRNAKPTTGMRLILERLTLPLTTHVVSNSEAGIRALRNQHALEADKMTLIPNGITLPIGVHNDAEDLRTHAEGKLHIGFVGYLTHQKGVEVLLRALAELKHSHQPIYTSIIGDGPELEHLTQEAIRLGLEDAVGFLGKQEGAAGLMRAFDVLVLPSLWEGMPNVIMEAMAQGIPVIATKVGGIPELVTPYVTGLLIEPEDAQALAQAILTLNDQHLRERMGAAGRARIEQDFTLETMIERFNQLYTSLLSSSKKHASSIQTA